MKAVSPKVSVLISSYNHADYVEEAIQSVLAQSYPAIELLVVDDGSSDDSVKRIERLQEKYGFDFRVQENKGLSRTLNSMIDRAVGEYVVPFGSDDVMLPERIKIQVEYMHDKPEVGICAGSIQEINAQGDRQGSAKNVFYRRLDFDDVFLDKKPGAPAPTLMFRKEALLAVGGFDPNIRLEDLLIELKITQASYFIDVLPEVLALYRVHGSNTYKNYSFMVEQVLKTYAVFSSHPAYEKVRAKYLNSMILRCSRADVELAKRLLKIQSLRYWDRKTVRAVLRLIFSS